MARKNINLGTNANDSTGDKLRDAMAKINDNLIELYARTGGDATYSGIGVAFSGNVIGIDGDLTISTNNNGNLTIAGPTFLTSGLTLPLGPLKVGTVETDLVNTLLVGGNAKVKGNTVLGDNVDFDTLTINGTISSTLVPTASLTYDLGTSSLRYRDAYIGTTNTTNIITPNANITGGSINSTTIGNSSPNEARFTVLRAIDDSFLGDLLIRDNIISTGTNNSDIEVRPFGTGNLLVSTKLIVGQTANPIGDAIIKAVSTVNGYVQSVIQNLSDSTTASSDLFFARDDGDDNNNYFDIGINSSTYNSIDYPIHTPGSSYIYTGNSDLFIGSYSLNDVIFHAGATLTPQEIAIRIRGDTSHVIVGPEDGSTIVQDTGEVLQVNGDFRVNGNINIQSRTIASSIGQAGDVAGLIAIDASYLYYCTANYDGSTSIWSRVNLSATPW